MKGGVAHPGLDTPASSPAGPITKFGEGRSGSSKKEPARWKE